MHDTALSHGKLFFDTYADKSTRLSIVDIGAQDVNGSLRQVAPASHEYIGLDFVEGKGVDIVIDDPYKLPLEDNSVDICVSSSCFEHSDFFWLSFLEVIRILKPDGLFYLNAPSNGMYHRYPVDSWRFYPDSGFSLNKWARRNGYSSLLLESFIGTQGKDMWNDFVAVFLKDGSHISKYPKRINENLQNYVMGYRYGDTALSKPVKFPEDQLANQKYKQIKRQIQKILD